MKVNTAVELLVQESFQLCSAMQQLSHSAASSLQNWLPLEQLNATLALRCVTQRQSTLLSFPRACAARPAPPPHALRHCSTVKSDLVETG